jgi:hypothetical protein
MGAHGADKLLEDVQTYHDMHNEIVVQKMHQVTPPRTGGRYAERPCGNPQCGECPKARHIAIGFSSSEQKATIISEDEVREPSPNPLSAADSPTLGIDGEANSNCSPPRSIAARRPSPPRIAETPDDPFDNTSPDNLFISPHLGKWDPIANGNHSAVDYRQQDIDRLLKRQGEQNERICRTSQVMSQGRRRTTPSSTPRKGSSKGRLSRGSGKLSKTFRIRGINRSCDVHSTRAA